MKKVLIAILVACILTGCATIIVGPNQRITINSNPSSAKVIVKELGGIIRFSGTTPASCKLPRKNEYTVHVKLEGYKEQTIFVNHSFNAWYIGNLLLGGIIGLIVDFADGAIWNLDPEHIYIELEQTVIDDQLHQYVLLKAVDDQGRLRKLKIKLIPDKTTITSYQSCQKLNHPASLGTNPGNRVGE